MRLLFLLPAAAAAAVFLSGSANTIRTYDDTEDRIARTPIGTKLDVFFTPDPPDSYELSVTAATVSTSAVRRFPVTPV